MRTLTITKEDFANSHVGCKSCIVSFATMRCFEEAFIVHTRPHGHGGEVLIQELGDAWFTKKFAHPQISEVVRLFDSRRHEELLELLPLTLEVEIVPHIPTN